MGDEKRTLDQLFVAYGEEVLARQSHESYENGDGTADDLEDCICGGESSAEDHSEAAAAIVDDAESRFIEKGPSTEEVAHMRQRANTLYHLQHSPLVSGLAADVMKLADLATAEHPHTAALRTLVEARVALHRERHDFHANQDPSAHHILKEAYENAEADEIVAVSRARALLGGAR